MENNHNNKVCLHKRAGEYRWEQSRKGPTTGRKWKSWDKKVQKADKQQEVNYREHKGTQDYHDETLHAKATDFDDIFDLKKMHKKTCNPFLIQRLNGRNSQLSGCPNTSVKTP